MKYSRSSIPSSDFNKFGRVLDEFMPSRGEGDNLGSQIVTAVNKLIYKWYNDGDVFDNTRMMQGWENDLSSYANWLAKNVPGSVDILDNIFDCGSDGEYEHLLMDLAEHCLDLEDIEIASEQPKSGSIYDCDGPYRFIPYRFIADLDSDDSEFEEEEVYDDEDDDEDDYYDDYYDDYEDD